MKHLSLLLLCLCGIGYGQTSADFCLPNECGYIFGPAPILQAALPDQILYQCCQFTDLSTDFWEHIECDHGVCTMTPEIYYPPRIQVPEPKGLQGR
jgi:hypothetical protein